MIFWTSSQTALSQSLRRYQGDALQGSLRPVRELIVELCLGLIHRWRSIELQTWTPIDSLCIVLVTESVTRRLPE